MLNLVSTDIFNISGRGTVATVDLGNQPDGKIDISDRPHVNNIILLNGKRVKVRGVEMSIYPMDPPRYSDLIGILYKEVT